VRNYLLGLFIAIIALAVAACGGQGAPGTPYPAAANVNGAGLSTSAPQTITLAQATGLAVGTAKISGSGTVAVSQSLSNPSGAPALAIKARTMTASSNTPLAYVTVTASTAATLSEVSLSLAPTASIPPGTYYLAFWNGSQWVTIGSPAQISGGIVEASTGVMNPAVSLTAGSSYYLAVYTGQIFTTPTPPPPAPVASPASTSIPEGTVGTIVVNSGQGITITASASPGGVVTIASPSVNTGTGTTATFTITAGLAVGSTTITFTDPLNRTTTTSVSVNDTAPTPSPSPGKPIIGLGDSTIVAIAAKPNTQITITTSAVGVASVATGAAGTPPPSPTAPSGGSFGNSATVTTSSTGQAYFWVDGVSGGSATISLTDIYANTGTLSVTVSSITNGAFVNGMTGWTSCSYAHQPLAAAQMTNAVLPLSSTPVPSQAPFITPNPHNTATPVPTTPTFSPVPVGSIPPPTQVTPPPNDNPGWSGPSASNPTTAITQNTGSVTISEMGTSYTIITPATSPEPVLGSAVALVGLTVTASTSNATQLPKGVIGMCQTITVPSAPTYLSMWVWEGGAEYGWQQADEEAAIFGSYSSNVASNLQSYLFVEGNCYLDPGTGTSGSGSGAESTGSGPGTWGGVGVDVTSGCWPSAYNGDYDLYYNWIQGGFWSPRGPFDLSAYEGQTVTLFIGVYQRLNMKAGYYANFMYVGNVETTASDAFPTAAPLIRGRSLGTVTLRPRSTVQTLRP
jgi:hypothetical protein